MLRDVNRNYNSQPGQNLSNERRDRIEGQNIGDRREQIQVKNENERQQQQYYQYSRGQLVASRGGREEKQSREA